MNTFRTVALATSMAFFVTQATSGTPDDPFGAKTFLTPKPGVNAIEHYIAASATSNFMCGMVFIGATASAKLAEQTPEMIAQNDYNRCIKDHSATVKANYAKAIKAAGKNAALARELKEHYILTLDQLQGIEPGAGERVIDYDRRTENQKRATEKQTLRVRAEMP